MEVTIRPVIYTFAGDAREYSSFEVYIDGEHFDSYVTRQEAEKAKRFILAQRY